VCFTENMGVKLEDTWPKFMASKSTILVLLNLYLAPLQISRYKVLIKQVSMICIEIWYYSLVFSNFKYFKLVFFNMFLLYQ